MSEYLDELRESARQVVEGAGTPALEESTWPLIVELGWLLTSVPESLDGLGLGIQELCALNTELGKGLSQSPFLAATMAIEALVQSDLADKADWLGRFTMGETATAPLTDSRIALHQNDSGQAVLSGLAPAVQSADTASHAILWTDHAGCIALVALQQPGVEVIERQTWDTTRRLYDVKLTNVPVDDQVVIGSGEEAQNLVARLETLRDFALAADSLGGSAALLDLTVEHLRTRKQFGRPLALFQALKHRCADLKTMLAAAEALMNDSLAGLDNNIGTPEARLAAKKAKYLACSVYARITEESLQLHGGIGMAVEYPCHLYLKRSMLNEHLGASEDHYTSYIADNFLENMA